MRKGLAFSIELCALAVGSAPSVEAASTQAQVALLAISWGPNGGHLRVLDARSRAVL